MLKHQLRVAAFLAASATGCIAQTCYPPQRPFVPRDPTVLKEFGEIIQDDFERYIQEIQRYFRCLDEERVRAFEEAHATSEQYGQVLEILSD